MIRQSKILTAILFIVVTLTAPVGCKLVGSALDGTQWQLTGWTLSALSPADFKITARFVDGQISGNSGVNMYSGPYKLGSGAAFSIGQIAATQMAGPEPAMRAESTYLTLLGEAKSYKMADGKLILYDGEGNESLIFAVMNN